VLTVTRVLTFGKVDTGWLAVALGISFTAGGLVAGVQGARLVGGGQAASRRYLPAGLLVVVALPPMWDFATSGLETSLVFAWLGFSFWALARRALVVPRPSPARPLWLPVLLGLGPLIRPDLAVFTMAFLLAHLCCSTNRWRAVVATLVAAMALPVVVEVGRMAYYGSLVPNTALAKEAGLPDWSRGWTYLVDLAGPYALVIPVALLVVAAATLPWRRWIGDRDRGRLAVVLAPVLGGVASAVYVVRLGGDFMHGRMLLPALFALVLPISVWTLPEKSVLRSGVRWKVALAAIAGVTLWSFYTASEIRVGYAGGVSSVTAIADERGFYMRSSGNAHPVTAADYSNSRYGRRATELARRARAGEDVLLTADGVEYQLPPGSGVVAVDPNIGVMGVSAGKRVRLIDPLGLADALAARIELDHRGRAGHEKDLPEVWVLAEYGLEPARADVGEARRALTCPGLQELHEAVTAPAGPALLLHNLVRSPRLTFLRVSGDPAKAVQQLC